MPTFDFACPSFSVVEWPKLTKIQECSVTNIFGLILSYIFIILSISGHLKFIYFCSIQGQNGSFFEKDDFSDLPPNQRRKRLQGKIEEITGKVTSLLEV